MKFIKSNEKKRIVNELEDFGIEKLPYLLIETGKEKIRGFSGSLMKEQIKELQDIARVEIIGMYLLRREKFGLRFSFDGSMVLNSGNVIEISNEDMDKWMRGEDLEIEMERGAYTVKNNEDILGTAWSNGEKLIGFIPKERRIRNS